VTLVALVAQSAMVRLLLTSNGCTTAALQQELCRMLGDERKTATCWYIPTAPLRDGWSERQARQAMAGVKQYVAVLEPRTRRGLDSEKNRGRSRMHRQFGLGRVEWIDPEYVSGAALEKAVADLGKVHIVWAEMGNTYNICCARAARAFSHAPAPSAHSPTPLRWPAALPHSTSDQRDCGRQTTCTSREPRRSSRG
jgi:hypothetical protein